MPVAFSSRQKLAKSLPKEQRKGRPLPTKAKPKKLASRLGSLAPEELAIIASLDPHNIRASVIKDNPPALRQAEGSAA